MLDRRGESHYAKTRKQNKGHIPSTLGAKLIELILDRCTKGWMCESRFNLHEGNGTYASDTHRR